MSSQQNLAAGDLQGRAWPQLKRGGAFVSTIGAPSAEEATARAARSVSVFTQTTQQLREAAALVEKGVVKVFVTKTLPLESAREAHELLEAHGVVGKLVLAVR